MFHIPNYAHIYDLKKKKIKKKKCNNPTEKKK